MANIKSQIKRNRTNEKARQRNKAVKSSLKTHVRKFREALATGDKAAATAQAQEASRAKVVAAAVSPASAASRNLRTEVFNEDLTALLR